MKFRVTFENGKMSFGTPEARHNFLEHTQKHPDGIYAIELWETLKQRRWFEGALVAMVCFYQEGMDHHSSEDLAKVRDWLKIEFNGAIVEVAGKAHKVGASTKGELNSGFTERVIDWMADQGYKVEYLNPDIYKDWRDRIRVLEDGPDNFIDYLVSVKKLP